jgi:hypothetical protein
MRRSILHSIPATIISNVLALMISNTIAATSDSRGLSQKEGIGYSTTCKNVAVNSQWQMSAECDNVKGESYSTVLDLARCLSVDGDGNLICDPRELVFPYPVLLDSILKCFL